MSKRIALGAVQLDADVCNNIEPPTRGCHAGGGEHVDIPSDWQARVLAGEQVPGCTYYALEATSSLTVSDIALTRLDLPALVNALAPPLKAQAALLKVKLLTATVVKAAQGV